MGKRREQIDQLKQAILEALERRRNARRVGELPRPIPAIALARRFGIAPSGSRETRRRAVRALIKSMRQDGAPILMSDRGYYLGCAPADYQAAEDFARKNGLRNLALGAAIRRHPETSDAAGQLRFF